MTKEEALEIVLSGEMWKKVTQTPSLGVHSIVTTVNERWIQANLLLNTMSYREAADTYTSADTPPLPKVELACEVLAKLYLEHRHDDDDVDIATAKERMRSLLTHAPNSVYDLIDLLEKL